MASQERQVSRFQSLPGIGEADDDLVPLDLHRVVKRPRRKHLHAVEPGLGPLGEALPHGLFVLRVDVLLRAGIKNDSHAGVRQFQRLVLGIAHPRPDRILGHWRHLAVGRQFHEQEGHVLLPPFLAPGADEILEHPVVGYGIPHGGASLRLTLVPDHTLDGEGEVGAHRSVIETAGMIRIGGTEGRDGSLECLFFLGSGRFHLLLPVLQLGLEGGFLLGKNLQGFLVSVPAFLARFGGNQRLLGEPGVEGRSAFCGTDQADRNPGALLKVLAKPVGDRTAPPDGVGSALHPDVTLLPV